MRLSDLKNRLNLYIQKTIPNIGKANTSYNMYNYIEIRNETEKLAILNLFENHFFNFLRIIPATNGRFYVFGQSDYQNFLNGLNTLRREVEILDNIIDKITIPDLPYLFDIELSKNITSMDDLNGFNKLLNDLCKSLETICISDKAICSLKFLGFERGSNHLQFLVESLNEIDIDTTYAYINKALEIAKEFLLLSGIWATNKLALAKAKSWESDAKLKEAQSKILLIADEDKKNFIANEIANSPILLKDKILEKATENLINRFIAIIEKGNTIVPSINAPKYIVQKAENVYCINEDELKRIVEEKNKPKEIESDAEPKQQEDQK